MQTVPQVSASLALDTPLLLILVLASAAISIALALSTVPGIVAKSQSSLTSQGKLAMCIHKEVKKVIILENASPAAHTVQQMLIRIWLLSCSLAINFGKMKFEKKMFS